MDFFESKEQEHFLNFKRQRLKQKGKKKAIRGKPEGLLSPKTVSWRNFLTFDKSSRFFLFQDAAGRDWVF